MTIRAAALAIDVLLVVMFVAQLTGSRDETVRVHYDKRAKREAASKPDVQIGKDGLRVEGEGASVAIGKDGISVKESKTPEGRRLAVDVGDDEDSETLYEDKGVRVSRGSKKKNVAFPVFWLAYSTLFLGLWKATPGKRICKLTVVRMNGLAIDWKDAFIRSLFSLISFIPPFVGFLWAVWEKDRRGWHDLLAGTRVEFRSF
ncbi:MAG: RDD family protein [Elusimicrobia bacterium]|nr:RDD family protein [Elusimicrobiota bacterium]